MDATEIAWFAEQPVLAVCGWSGAGKTTMLAQLVPQLRRQGLRIAVLKHDVHGITLDAEGKDSDRLFRAGADVALTAPDQELWRRHASGVAAEPGEVLRRLLDDHDLILVEGHRTSPLPKVWLATATEPEPPPEISRVIEVLPWDGPRVTRMAALIEQRLTDLLHRRPRYGGILIGGKSTRMGSPKQLLSWHGQPLLERIADAMATVTEKVLVVGNGPLPETLTGYTRLADIADSDGPLAGILACQRWAPHASWFIAACDLPLLTPPALAWLDSQRAPGRWAVLPRVDSDSGRIEPLLAVYEPCSRWLLERLLRRGEGAPRHITGHSAVVCPQPPEHLVEAWANLNRPQDLPSLPQRG